VTTNLSSLSQIAVATAYRKLDNLSAPILQGGVGVGRTTWLEKPGLALSLSRPTHDPGLARLLTMLATAAGRLVAFEPTNDTMLHSVIPSPRGLRAVDIDIVFAAGPGEQAHRVVFCPIAGAWILTGAVSVAARYINAVVEIWFVPDRIVPKYGELAITLGLLEAGHVVAEVYRLLADGLGATDATGDIPQPRPTDVRSRLAVIPFKLTDPIIMVPDDTVAVRVPISLLDDEARKYVDQVCANQNSAFASAHVRPPAASFAQLTLGAAARSSGYHPNGVWARPIDAKALIARIAAAWPAITMAASWAEALVEPVLLVRCTDGWSRWSLDGDEVSGATPVADSLIRRAFGGGFDYNTSSLSAVFILRADLRPAATDTDPNRYARALQAAGAAAQIFCRAAAAEGIFARPLRGFDELAIDVTLGGPRQAVYAVVVGGQRAPLVRFELG
jgi:Nitroreductase family